MKNCHRGISLLEIVIAMVILALVLVGLVNVFVMSKGYIAHSRSRISAGELGKQFLDPLQAYVDQSTWEEAGGNNLSRDHNFTGSKTIVNNIEFTPQYNVTAGPAGTELRKVTVNITWNEPQS